MYMKQANVWEAHTTCAACILCSLVISGGEMVEMNENLKESVAVIDDSH
jgi:hypothetical protein